MTDTHQPSYAEAHDMFITPASGVDRFDEAQVLDWVDQVEMQLRGLLPHFELESELVPANIAYALEQVSVKARTFIETEPRLPFMAHQLVAFAIQFNAAEFLTEMVGWPLRIVPELGPEAGMDG